MLKYNLVILYYINIIYMILGEKKLLYVLLFIERIFLFIK